MATRKTPADFIDETSSYVPQDVIPLDSLKSNANSLPTKCRAVRAVVAGNVKVTTAAGHDRTFPILAGETRWIAFNKLFDTGTTATGLEGLV
jgi:hypothetical protein